MKMFMVLASGFEEPEAIHKLIVKNFPLVVAIDAEGNSLYTH